MALPSLFDSQPPAVRRPIFEIAFGGGVDAWKQALVSLTLDLGLGPAVDVAEMVFAVGGAKADGGGLAGAAASLTGGGDASPESALGEQGEIALGYEDEGAETLFSGTINSVSRGLGGSVRLTAVNGGSALARLRLNQSYEQQAAGDLVSDLAAKAGVSTGSVEAGIDLAFLVVDDRRSAYRHIAALAERCGFLALFEPSGDLRFAPPAEEVVQTFTYAVDILALEVAEREPLVAGAVRFGEGAAGSSGQDAWPWLVGDPAAVTGEAGADPNWARADGALRAADSATSAAAGRLQAASFENVTGRLWVPGAAKVGPGSTVEISAAPHDLRNGKFLVRQVRHRYTKRGGFTSLLRLSKAGEGGFGLVLGALGGLL